MADNYAICLLGAMDRLWFHQIILFSEPTSLLFPKSPKTPLPISESFTTYRSSSCTSIPEEDVLSDASAVTPDQQDNDSEIEDSKKIIELKERQRPSRLNVISAGKTRCQSSSPSTHKLLKSLSYSSSAMRLQKTMSCKSLSELEVEEVKGFMDLGFRFNKEHLCPRMMSVVPGLQRLGSYNNVKKGMIDDVTAVKDDKLEEDDDEEKRGTVMRPYLSEAWLIKRPDSRLLNLRIPRVSAAAEMKKHLKYWARTVASVIQQGS